MVKLNILDYAVIDEGRTAQEALADTIALAKRADQIGYHRFWMAEHHNVPAFASSSPELFMMKIADETDRIRVGSGGVMLPHYSPFKVAENFKVLEGFHPGRIDLGMGNTVGTPEVKAVLNEKKQGLLGYEQSVQDIYKYLSESDDPNHRFNEVRANPQTDTMPEMFMLSASERSARIAANNGLGYTFGFFPYPSKDKAISAKKAIQLYRDHFKPSKSLAEPTVILSIFVAVSDDAELAEKHQKSLEVWLLGKDDYGEFERFPSHETAAKYQYSSEDEASLESQRERMAAGHIDQVEEQLKEILQVTKADELQIIPLIPGIDQRLKAIELIYERFSSY